MKYRAIKNFKKEVENVLRDYPETRNSDIALMVILWKKIYPHKIVLSKNMNLCVELYNLEELPRESEIGRIRRKIQEKMYLPTDEKVARARRMNMDEWRVAMGYPTVASAGTQSPSWTPESEK